MDTNSEARGHSSADSQDDAVLEQYGYHQAFDRTISKFASFAVAFSFISIATGIFTTYGYVLETGGPLGIWTWPLVGIGQGAVALIFASLAAQIPLSGYSYQWATRLANPSVGWLLGWLSFAFLSIVVVAVDSTLAARVLPALLGYESTTLAVQIGTIAILVVQGLLIMFSTRATAAVNSWAVAAELIGIVLLAVVLLAVVIFTGDANYSNLFDRGTAAGTENYFGLFPVGAFVFASLIGAFTIVGFESAANLAEETHEPHKVVPRAMWGAVLSATVLGFLFLVAITLAIGDVATVTASSTSVADVVQDTLGTSFGGIFIAFVGIAIFACGLVIFVTGVRLTWAMSRDGRFPGHAIFSRVNPRTDTPVWATFLIFGLGVVWTMGISSLTALFSAATLLPALIYAGTVLMYLSTRGRQAELAAAEDEQQRRERFSLGRWEIPVVAVALIWLAIELWMLLDEQFRTAHFYVLGMVAVGGLYYLFMRVRNPEVLRQSKTTDPEKEA
jgi:amino acid transporter